MNVDQSSRHRWTWFLAPLLLLGVFGEVFPRAIQKSPVEDLKTAQRDLIEKTRVYRSRIEAELPFLRSALEKRVEQVGRLRPLLEKGYVARVEALEAERARDEAEALLRLRENELETAARILVEAEADLRETEREETSWQAAQAAESVIRFRGATAWNLTRTAEVANFFWKRFGRELPISAFGQTATHDALGFDHRGQIDVAVHPDSPEGQALMGYLKERSISFVGFSGAVAGKSTAAHIHVGRPSPRLF